MDVFLQQEAKRRSMTWLGLILVGGGAALGLYVWLKLLKPRSQIVGTPSATTKEIRVRVRNVGRKAGYFKLAALILKPGCAQGIAKDNVYGSGNWGDLKASGCLIWEIPDPKLAFSGPIPPGGETDLVAPFDPGQKLSPGTYDVYLVAAVKEKQEGGRIYSNEHYRFFSGVRFS